MTLILIEWYKITLLEQTKLPGKCAYFQQLYQQKVTESTSDYAQTLYHPYTVVEESFVDNGLELEVKDTLQHRLVLDVVVKALQRLNESETRQ